MYSRLVLNTGKVLKQRLIKMLWVPLAKQDFSLWVKTSSSSDPDELSKPNYVRGGRLLTFVLWWNYSAGCGCEVEIICVLLHQQYSCEVHFCSGKVILDTGGVDELSFLDINLKEQIFAFPRGKNGIRECFVINNYVLSTFSRLPHDAEQDQCSAGSGCSHWPVACVSLRSTLTTWQQGQNLGFKTLKCSVGAVELLNRQFLWAVAALQTWATFSVQRVCCPAATCKVASHSSLEGDFGPCCCEGCCGHWFPGTDC